MAKDWVYLPLRIPPDLRARVDAVVAARKEREPGGFREPGPTMASTVIGWIEDGLARENETEQVP